MRAAVVVVAWNGEKLLPACLDSLLATAPVPDLVVVDNGSRDETARILSAAASSFRASGARFVLVEPGRNLGFTLGANAGLEQALALDPPPDFVVLLNQDATLAREAMDAFAGTFSRTPQAGAIGARILFSDGERIQHAGGRLERPRMLGLHLGHHEPARADAWATPSDPDFVTGAVVALRTEALLDVGFFDPIFSPGFYEDVDLCLRLRAAGYRVLFEPMAEARHFESASFSDRPSRFRLSTRNRLIFAAGFLDSPERLDELEREENAAIDAETSIELLAALVGGSLEAILRLPEAVPRRLDAATASGAIALFGRIRRRALERLARGMAGTPRV